MADFENGERATPRRFLGGPNSWRRIVLAGLGAGVVVAFAAALIAAALDDGGGGALDKGEPTAIAPGLAPGAPVVTEEPVIEPPVDVIPTEEPLPTEPPPTEEPLPTEPPPTEAPPPTDPPVEPTAEPPAEGA